MTGSRAGACADGRRSSRSGLPREPKSPKVMASMRVDLPDPVGPSRRNSPPAESSTMRSEEHTSELQSRGHLVCRLLLEKKKHQTDKTQSHKEIVKVET